MLTTIARLFGKSPFAPLQTHMEIVANCIKLLSNIVESLPTLQRSQLDHKVTQLSNLEHEADSTKNDIRNHLPKSIFMPMARSHFLDILALQDQIADKAEEIGLLLNLRPLEETDDFIPHLQSLFRKNTEAFEAALSIIREIDELLESSFGGLEAEKVKTLVEQAAYKEFEANRLKKTVLKELLQIGETLSPPSFYLRLRLVEEISAISELSEKLGNRIRMVLELS